MCEMTRRERKKEATRLKIMETAIRLFKKRGFEQTTMNRISEEADVALGTLYNYFPSKEAIVGAYVGWVVADYREKNWPRVMELPSTYERFQFVLLIIAHWHEENKELSEIYISDLRNFYYGPNWEPVPKDGLEEGFTDIFKMGQEKGDVTDRFSSQTMARQLLGALYSATLHWLAESDGEPLKDRYLEVLDLFFKGCGRNDGVVSVSNLEVLYYMFF
ncbi:transcriptional regulator, TetR family [Thermincola ferriacetica]|uniref:Transcriptional regulator, TetR family n=2 Tax=Thermincola ferriacetica TaxID=281456 RepID=A0A0L6W5N7_9FIRM|nr:transcriptional regulator, TetR family [Thermincola ferriacetica]